MLILSSLSITMIYMQTLLCTVFDRKYAKTKNITFEATFVYVLNRYKKILPTAHVHVRPLSNLQRELMKTFQTLTHLNISQKYNICLNMPSTLMF